ncbi:hypothetical protein BMS3Bbin15_00642 [archaeon BMS3Bbin15]|nr:hypothetical protein BMS3Bbin15_00642 [archaeon BMS3Bbin15]
MGEKVKEGIGREGGYMLLIYGQELDKSISGDKHSKNKREIKADSWQS